MEVNSPLERFIPLELTEPQCVAYIFVLQQVVQGAVPIDVAAAPLRTKNVAGMVVFKQQIVSYIHSVLYGFTFQKTH